MFKSQIKISPVHNWLAERTGLGSQLNPKRLEEYQLAKLRELMDYVQTRSSFYKSKLGAEGSRIVESLDDLADLPFLTAGELISRGEEMICVPQSRVARVITISTSGTAGQPKRLFFSESDLELCLDFFAHGMLTMVEKGDRVEIHLPGNSPDGVVDLLRTGLKRAQVDSVWRDPAGPQNIPEGDCLVGMPANLYQLAQIYPEARPKSVLLCADYVPESIIEALKKIWMTNVFTHYGSTESGQGGGVECAAHDGYHIREADLLIEIIDPVTRRPVPPGAVGEIVLTTLTRQAMPLIRYRTGDMASRIDSPCACGSNLSRLGKAMGRFDNVIKMKSGAFISIHQLDEIMFRFPEVLDYQAALNSGLDRLDLTVRPHLVAPDPEVLIEQFRSLIDASLLITYTLDWRCPSALPLKRTIQRL